MLLMKKNVEEHSAEPDPFGYSEKYITDELELIQDQEENIVHVSEELAKAFTQTDKIRELQKIVKKIDETIMKKNVEEKRRQESRLINLMEDVRGLLKAGRYEDIERLMLEVHQESQLKIRLSNEELNNLRAFMGQLAELYKEAAGLCRLYTLVYERLKQIYAKCEQELGVETTEEVELSKAGPYREHIH